MLLAEIFETFKHFPRTMIINVKNENSSYWCPKSMFIPICMYSEYTVKVLVQIRMVSVTHFATSKYTTILSTTRCNSLTLSELIGFREIDDERSFLGLVRWSFLRVIILLFNHLLIYRNLQLIWTWHLCFFDFLFLVVKYVTT